MKYLLFTVWMVLTCHMAGAQTARDTLGGEVSYVTSQSVYVRFNSTQTISAGDTLFTMSGGTYRPALVVRHLSSTSCVGDALPGVLPEKGMRMYFKTSTAEISTTTPDTTPVVIAPVITPETSDTESASSPSAAPVVEGEKPSLKGRVSAAAYITFGDNPLSHSQRMRYVLSATARRINNSRLSAEVYMAFRHTINEWDDVQKDFLQAYKVYGLSLEYDFGNGLRTWAGRKINFNISNIGAIDGVQAEKKWKNVLLGGFGGFRPDHTDYGFNSDLVQYGAYVGNIIHGKNGQAQNTLALVEQRNAGMTDRRFMYFQHINSAIKRMHVFTSFEFDLYTLENNQPKNTFDITSLYLSARYRISDKLSVFGSFDSRNNIVYYETYKNFIDQLLEDETRQGFRLTLNYRPVKKLTIGANAGYRYQKNTPGDSKNMHAYLTYSRIPGINASGTVNATLIHSPYLDGIVYGARLSKDLIKGKVFGELQYRVAHYQYRNVEIPIDQSILGMNLSWRLTRKLSFGINYEAEIQQQNWNNRIYTNLTERF